MAKGLRHEEKLYGKRGLPSRDVLRPYDVSHSYRNWKGDDWDYVLGAGEHPENGASEWYQMSKPYHERKVSVGVICVVILLGLGFTSSFSSDPEVIPVVADPTCSDGIDNDGDGLMDNANPECDPLSPSFDDDESGDA